MDSAQLGTYLREGREAAGLTAEMVAQETRIPSFSIEALEQGRFDDLPALVFVKGFVKSYCRAVGLDPRPALEELNGRQDPRAKNPGLLFAGVQQPVFLTHAAPTRPRALRLSRIFLALIAVAILVAAYVLAGGQESATSATAASDGAPATRVPGAPAHVRPDTRLDAPD